MFKQLYTSFLTSVLLTFSGILNAQISDVVDKDLYHEPIIKGTAPAGKKIPAPDIGDRSILYDNGPIITNPGGGYGGYDASAVQTILLLNTWGFGAQINLGYSLADDFTIPESAWRIIGFQFLTYQTGSNTTSTITDLQVQIYDGPPDSRGTVIWGDLATNRLTCTEWTNIYRALDYNILDTLRCVMNAEMEIMPPIMLPAGTYWVEFRFAGTLPSGPYVPPISIPGQPATGNALQNTNAGWAAVMDDYYPQGFPFLILGNCGPPCPVEEPTNPYPPDSASSVQVSGSNLAWANGAGTNQIELWFGEMGNMTQVYSGEPITSFELPNLNYSTTYLWYVIAENDTCNTQGPVWTFTTIQDSGLIIFEEFNDLSCWTPMGPYGLTNWSANPTNNAGGNAPELRLNTVPSFNGLSQLLSCVFTTSYPGTQHQLSLRHFCDWQADPAPSMGLGITYDGGASYDELWSFTPVGGDVGPEFISLTYTPSQASFRFILFADGDSYNINDWYVDEILGQTVPVELTSFTAAVGEGLVELKWITATETNNRGFTVQRSTNEEFENVAFVDGYGTTTETHVYSYSDRDVNNGTCRYRLKQIDFDGSFQYSEVIEVTVPAPDVFVLDQNYPNPFNPSTKISWHVAVGCRQSIRVYNILGSEAATIIDEYKPAGSYEVEFNTSELPSGVYFYQLRVGNFIQTKKMILIR